MCIHGLEVSNVLRIAKTAVMIPVVDCRYACLVTDDSIVYHPDLFVAYPLNTRTDAV